MKYMGSKMRYAHEFIPIILGSDVAGCYVEPFVGGANVIDKIPTSFFRIGNDANEYLIALYQAVQAGWIPPSEISERDYRSIRYNRAGYPKELVGFAGIACSYGGRWFKTYQRGTTPNGDPRNYVAETRAALLAQSPALAGVFFTAGDYGALHIADGSIVYCDPPYVGAAAPYSYQVRHDHFWRWAESLVRDRGCRVFVSEYNAPRHWRSVWSKEVKTTLGPRRHADTAVENLYTLS